MNIHRVIIPILAATLSFCLAAEEKPRLFVLTDIANEPDDEESLVRLLVYSNEFDIEGLVATTSIHMKRETREDLIRRMTGAYGKVRENLLKHAPGYPSVEALGEVTTTGQTDYGMACVGAGKNTEGSKLLIAAVDRADDRPLWVNVWGGANTLAQALTDVKATRDAAALAKFVAKIRVYSISDQDDAGAWIRASFPKLFYIVCPGVIGGNDYYRAAWTGISGDKFYKNGPLHKFEMVENPWLEANVIRNHGPLGELYPKVAYIMEGDTPAFLGLINNGLGWNLTPANGGWGGRYTSFRPHGETRPIWTENKDSRDTVTTENGVTVTSHQATVWRWREHFQNDFAARMDWCVAETFENANHHPKLSLNGDATKNVMTLQAKSGSEIELSAEGSSDPDKNNKVRLSWWIYQEAGTIGGGSLSSPEDLTTIIRVPKVKKPGTLHVILQGEDDGVPQLTSYRRAIIEVTP